MEINTEDLWARYYSARVDDETMIVIEQNLEQLQATLDATVSQKGVLSNVSVGMQGFVFAVSGRSYVIEYHPDEDMIGKDALNSGVSVASLEDGEFSWITLDGKEYYCGVQEIDQTYYISAIPEKEIVGSRNITVGIILFIFVSVMTIVVTYGIFIMREDEKKEESEMQTTGMWRMWRRRYSAMRTGRKNWQSSIMNGI